jgi:hypothetical protein
MSKLINQYRVRTGPMASNDSDGMNGAFKVPVEGDVYNVIASDQMGWLHVRVSRANGMKPPVWSVMCVIKDLLLFGEDAWAVQYHPSKDDNINNHPGCLHMWWPNDSLGIAKPPSFMVGIK